MFSQHWQGKASATFKIVGYCWLSLRIDIDFGVGKETHLCKTQPSMVAGNHYIGTQTSDDLKSLYESIESIITHLTLPLSFCVHCNQNPLFSSCICALFSMG